MERAITYWSRPASIGTPTGFKGSTGCIEQDEAGVFVAHSRAGLRLAGEPRVCASGEHSEAGGSLAHDEPIPPSISDQIVEVAV